MNHWVAPSTHHKLVLFDTNDALRQNRHLRTNIKMLSDFFLNKEPSMPHCTHYRNEIKAFVL